MPWQTGCVMCWGDEPAILVEYKSYPLRVRAHPWCAYALPGGPLRFNFRCMFILATQILAQGEENCEKDLQATAQILHRPDAMSESEEREIAAWVARAHFNLKGSVVEQAEGILAGLRFALDRYRS